MAITEKETLKKWFETGKKPTQEQFATWIDSYIHHTDQIPLSLIAGLNQVLIGKADRAVVDILAQYISGIINDEVETSSSSTYSIDKIKELINESVIDISKYYTKQEIEDNFWSKYGNEEVDSTDQFIGTVDGSNLSVKTNNHEKIRFTSTGIAGLTPKGNIFLSDDFEKEYDVNGEKVKVPDPYPYAFWSTVTTADYGSLFNHAFPFVTKVPTDSTKPVSVENPLIDKLEYSHIRARAVSKDGWSGCKKGDILFLKAGLGNMVFSTTRTVDHPEDDIFYRIAPNGGNTAEAGLVIKAKYVAGSTKGKTVLGFNVADPSTDIDLLGEVKLRTVKDSVGKSKTLQLDANNIVTKGDAIPVYTTLPVLALADEGYVVYYKTTKNLCIWNGTHWVDLNGRVIQ